METGPGCKGRYPRRSGRGALLLGVIALTFSLLAPLALATDPAVARGEKECPDGQVLDPERGCVDDPTGAQKECPDGQILDPRQGCVDDPAADPKDQDPPACPEGQTFDEKQQQCVGDTPAKADEPVRIQLALRLCPEEVKAPDLGLDGLVRQCPENTNPVTIVHGGDGIADEKEQVVGNSAWSGPAGNHYLSAVTPEGFGQPRVFCGLVDPRTGRPDLREMRVDNGGAVWLKLDSGQTAQCLWFDVAVKPGGDPAGSNQIDVIAHTCPAGIPDLTSVDDYRKACAPDAGWEFTLTTPDGPLDPVFSDEKGHAGWGGLPGGDWRLQEVLPDRFDDPIVFCRWTNWPWGVRLDRSWAQIPAPGGVLPGRFDGDLYRIECSWFNHEPAATVEEGNTYALTKYDCPEGVGPNESLATYQDACSEPSAGVEFEIDYDGMVVLATTDGHGQLEVSGIPNGDWRVTETIPAGYGDPRVWCHYTDWPDDIELRDDWFEKAAPGGRMTGGFDIDGTRFECSWYNVREHEPQLTTIEVYKLWCPYGTSQSGDIEYLRNQCDFEDIPVEFTLTAGGIAMSSTASGATPAEWPAIDGDDVTLEEAIPDGWEVLTVWCQVNADGGFLEPVELPVDEGETDLDSGGSGMTMSCAYFNVQTAPDWPPEPTEEAG